MNEEEIAKFDITEATLRGMVAESSSIVNVDIDNKEDIDKVKKARIELGKMRVEIKKFGKGKRDWFNEMSSKIITREKELIAIIEPEEDRLYAFEEELKKKKEQADRVAVLPQRIKQLQDLDDGIEIDNNYLNTLTAEQFMGYCNKRLADKNQKKTDELRYREDEIKRKEAQIKYDQDIKDAEERARTEEKDRAEKRKIEEELSRQIQKEQEERKEELEKERIEKNQKYTDWLKSNGCTEETISDFVIERVGTKIRLSKIIGIYDTTE